MARRNDRSIWDRATAACAFASLFVLVKNVGWIGATPWACAAVDALILLILLLFTARYGFPHALPGALIVPVVDWLQGSLAGFLIPFSIVGYVAAVVLWSVRGLRRPLRVALCALAASVPTVLGTAAGYMALKSLGASEALRTALRSRWYILLWFAGACAFAVWLNARRAARRGQPDT